MVGRWTCNPDVPASNPPPFLWMDLSSVAPNSTPPRFVNSQLVKLPPIGILNLLCLICIIFVCYAHLIIFTWNLRDINVNYYYIIIITFYGYITNSQGGQLPDGLIAQLVEHCTGIAEVMGSNFFSGFNFTTA